MYDLNGNGRMDVGDHMLYDSFFGGGGGGGGSRRGGGSGCATMILMGIAVMTGIVTCSLFLIG